MPSRWYLAALLWVLRILGYRMATISAAMQAPFGRFACLTFDSTDHALHSQVFPKLAKVGVPATVFVATRDIRRRNVRGPTLSWSHLQEMIKAGWEVGSLGHEASDLTAKGYRDQRRQVGRSIAVISDRLGQQPSVFAYPFGAYDTSAVACVRDEGDKAAVTLRRGLNASSSEPFQLRRLPLGTGLWSDVVAVAKTALLEVPVPDLREQRFASTPESKEARSTGAL